MYGGHVGRLRWIQGPRRRVTAADQQPFPNRELTLNSYLCDKPTLASAAVADAAASAAADPSSPPKPADASAVAVADAVKLCVERDFLHLFVPKHGGDPPGPGDDSSVVGKKPRLDSLHLSLSLASDRPSSQQQQAQQLPSLLLSAPTADGDLRATSAGAAPPPRRTYSATTSRTRSINSDNMYASWGSTPPTSASCSLTHNPSCSLTHNSTDIYVAGEGTVGIMP